MNNNYKNDIKILGGKFRGKLLHVLDNEGLRPTPSRVRETIFSWLNQNIQNAKVLDLFAGSGSLGFEAFSRGARNVTLIELNRDNYLNLKNCASDLGSGSITVINTSAITFLENTDEQFDIVFIDPPYKCTDLYEQSLKLLIKRNLISDSSLIYVEMRNGYNCSAPGYEIFKEENAGQAKYTLWRKSKLLF
ncbi:MAG: 16S rRNA (guanine(966)-N(2))-methyltransferase RsmD [Succinivibrio sp.]